MVRNRRKAFRGAGSLSKSTIYHIFTLFAIVQKYLLRNKLYVAFVDFKRALESVNRNMLWNVLRNNGGNGRMYKVLRDQFLHVLDISL